MTDFADPTWDPDERDVVARYLGAGLIARSCVGCSTCRSCGKRDNSDLEFSDGVHVWCRALASNRSGSAAGAQTQFTEVRGVSRSSMIMDMGDLVLSDDWDPLDDGSQETERLRATLLAELELELGPGHVLWGRVRRIEARYWPSDDVIVSLDDGTYAVVHLTWIHKTDRLPWPLTDLFASGADVNAKVAEWERWR